MKKNIDIFFDKNKTIKENAILTGVSERTVKNYMSKKSISGYENNHNKRVLKLNQTQKEFKNKGIKPTVKNLSQSLNWSNNTVTKYKKLIEDNIKEGNKILPQIALKRDKIIKSTNKNQIEILTNIIKLHIIKKEIDCDLTYSIGNFYKNDIAEPKHKFDKYPQIEGVKQLNEIENILENSLDSIVCDPPFVLDCREHNAEKPNNKMIDRFSYFKNPTEMFNAYEYLIRQSYRTLSKKGIFVFKCMSTSWGGKQIDTPFFVKQTCYDIGFSFVDEFVLIADRKISNRRHHNQKHSWKWHSFFLVFQKLK